MAQAYSQKWQDAQRQTRAAEAARTPKEKANDEARKKAQADLARARAAQVAKDLR